MSTHPRLADPTLSSPIVYYLSFIVYFYDTLQIQDIRLLEKMIKNRQERSGITAKLNARYGASDSEFKAAEEAPAPDTHADPNWEISRRQSGTGVTHRSLARCADELGIRLD